MKRRDFLKVFGALPLALGLKQVLSFPKPEEAVLSEYEIFNTSGWGNRYWPNDVLCDAIVENRYGETWYTANIRDDKIQWERIGWAEMRCDEGIYYLPVSGID